MRSDLLVYLSGPITAVNGYSVQDNVASAHEVYLTLVCAGLPAICVHHGALCEQSFDIDYETWMSLDFALIDRCTDVLMLPRWETSKGATRERDYAWLNGKQVHYSIDELIAHVQSPART